MVNWKKWFLEEDEDEIYEESTSKKEKKDDFTNKRGAKSRALRARNL